MAFSTIQGSGSAPDSFVGTSGVDSIAIVDSTGDYYLVADDANDVLSLVSSNNPLSNSTVVNNATLKGGSGSDSFAWTSASPTTYVGAYLNGNADADTFAFAAADSFIGSAIKGGQGADTINGSISSFSAALVNGNKDNDTLTFDGIIASSSLYGGQGDDTISGFGTSAAVTNSDIRGDLGNDTINFSLGNKSLNGTSISGGDGIDSINLQLSGVAGDTVWVNGDEGTDTIFGGVVGNASLFGGDGIDNITANGAATTIVGGTGADVLTSFAAGVDSIYYTATGEGGSAFAANSTSALALAGGDTILSFTSIDFVGIETDMIIGSTNVASTITTPWNLNNTGVAIVNGNPVTTVAGLSGAVGNVVGDAGDTAYLVYNDPTANTGSSTLAQVTLGATHAGVAGAGTALGALDTINILGTFSTTALAAGQIQFI